ncbi:hypothetical protein PYCCODRAFT_208620 [Trametes coccinea BRFM310]|uniref:Uncharacterized protein n=1 Tax=Trametes coccinea (strain BRFM310) TaxID=1353009 RepID=A0A1Y2IS10_TRAC3|nr:hypothetical protein PYCCODRAFT_208620 [Trametes coccinea BRFM310]
MQTSRDPKARSRCRRAEEHQTLLSCLTVYTSLLRGADRTHGVETERAGRQPDQADGRPCGCQVKQSQQDECQNARRQIAAAESEDAEGEKDEEMRRIAQDVPHAGTKWAPGAISKSKRTSRSGQETRSVVGDGRQGVDWKSSATERGGGRPAVRSATRAWAGQETASGVW